MTFFTLCARVDFHVEEGSPGMSGPYITGIAMISSSRSSALVRANGSCFGSFNFVIVVGQGA